MSQSAPAPTPSLGVELLPVVVKGEEPASEAEKIFNRIDQDKKEIKDRLEDVVDGWNRIMEFARERPTTGVPRFFTWDNQKTLDVVENSYGFLIKLIIDLEDAGVRAGHEALKKVTPELPTIPQITQPQQQSPLQPVVNVNVQQPQPKEGLPSRVRSAASRIMSREQMLAQSPMRTMYHDREVKYVLDNYKQFQPNWNRFIAWYQPTLELVTVFKDVAPEVYWYELSQANEFLRKLRFQMVGGAYASAQKLNSILDKQRVELAEFIMQLAIKRQEEEKARTWFGKR